MAKAIRFLIRSDLLIKFQIKLYLNMKLKKKRIWFDENRKVKFGLVLFIIPDLNLDFH